MTRLMASIKEQLPPHCIIKQRKGYADVYFHVHPKDRPEGWLATIPLGRLSDDNSGIIQRAKEVYAEYIDFRTAQALGHATELKEGSIPDIITRYKQSYLWTDLATKTQKDYDSYLTLIYDWSKRAAHPHISKMTVQSIMAWLKTFDKTLVKQKRAKIVLSILFKVAFNEGFVQENIVKNITLRKRKSEDKRAVTIWTQEDVDRVVSEADARGLYSIGGIILTAMETAQRRSDVVHMINGKDYKDGKLQYYQQKTKKNVWFNATNKLKSRLNKYHSNQLYMFVNENTGKLWHVDSVTHKVRQICDSLGMPNHILMELRHSQATYLYEVGCSDEIITAVTGHSNPQTLRKHYKESRNEVLANKGIELINAHRKKEKT